MHVKNVRILGYGGIVAGILHAIWAIAVHGADKESGAATPVSFLAWWNLLVAFGFFVVSSFVLRVRFWALVASISLFFAMLAEQVWLAVLLGRAGRYAAGPNDSWPFLIAIAGLGLSIHLVVQARRLQAKGVSFPGKP